MPSRSGYASALPASAWGATSDRSSLEQTFSRRPFRRVGRCAFFETALVCSEDAKDAQREIEAAYEHDDLECGIVVRMFAERRSVRVIVAHVDSAFPSRPTRIPSPGPSGSGFSTWPK